MDNKKFTVPMETFYIMVAQKMGSQYSPTLARKYGEAIQEVIYEQLEKNDSCYWYGFGLFEKVVSSYTGKHKEIYNYMTNRRETKWIEPKYVMKFKPRKTMLLGLNEGEEKLPRYKKKRKYNIKPREYEDIRNERRRKVVQPLTKIVDGLLADARYEENE